MLPFTLAPKSPQLPEAKEVVATLALTKQMNVYLADQVELLLTRLKGAFLGTIICRKLPYWAPCLSPPQFYLFVKTSRIFQKPCFKFNSNSTKSNKTTQNTIF